ncbi:hypothetical protein [Candidatus Chlamydia corallus]|uniref:hypothetical protein n=1 Tax=Candidatus Chlamydia corallus TaxID=2038470 RepID=UPI000C2F8BEA|nr:hypothetical protein [Candidatus Chlamydia corallus]
MTREEELILAANPKLVQAAAEAAFPVLGLPKKYYSIKVETLEGVSPKITISANMQLLLQDLDIESINWPKLHLHKDLDFTGHPEEKALIEQIRDIEKNNTTEFFCSKSKKLLTLHFLKCLFENPESNNITLDFTYDESTYGKNQTMWYQIYFCIKSCCIIQSSSFEEPGDALYCNGLLKKLGFSLGRLTLSSGVGPSSFSLQWDPLRKRSLETLGFFPRCSYKKEEK